MVKLKFILKDGSLVLRISEGKERYYKSVQHLLIGRPNIEKHWNADKERFTSSATSYAENNKNLGEFKGKYTKLLLDQPGMTARQIAGYFKPLKKVPCKTEKQAGDDEYISSSEYMFVEKYLQEVITREKAKQGCNFELYAKLLSKARKIIKDFPKMTFSSINYKECVRLANVFAQHKGYRVTSKSFRNLLGKAGKDPLVPFSITQIGDFRFSEYDPNRNSIESKVPDVLTTEQLRWFLNADVSSITPSYDDRKTVELYHDFCVFMFHSFFAPCDVIKLKHSDITRNNSIRVKRKKTHRQVDVPVSQTMSAIIEKYRGATKNDYVFPIMDDELEKKYDTKDYLFKKFRERLNIWLKHVGKEMDLDYNLYAYVFRHTAITVAINSGLPVSYVAVVAGTSIEMIQDHYYNGDSAANHQKLHTAFAQAGL